jgi:hypothetical protein
MRATKESNDFTSGEIISKLPYMRAVRDIYNVKVKNNITFRRDISFILKRSR